MAEQARAGIADAVVLYTLEETASILRKSPAQLRWMLHRGTAPKSALIGGRRMFRAADVSTFVDEQFREAS